MRSHFGSISRFIRSPSLRSPLWRGAVAWAASSCLACTPCPREPYTGTFTVLDRGSSYVIAAPHGEFDGNTAQLVREYCALVRWDCLVAEGFRDYDLQVNVNRPTEGVRLADERVTERATRVYEQYQKRLQSLSTRTSFYVEIHGHEFDPLDDTIEIATVGVSANSAERLRTTVRRALDEQQLTNLVVRIDVLEPIRFKATRARELGTLSTLAPALHIELPHSARGEQRLQVVAALVKALNEQAPALVAAAPSPTAR